MTNPYKSGDQAVAPKSGDSFAINDWTEELDPIKAADMLLAGANQGDRRRLSWVRRFADDGVTASMVRKIGSKLRQLPTTARLIPMPVDKTFEWQIRLQDSSRLTDEEFAYLLAMLVIRAGLATRIKKCEFTECKDPYFLGNSKAKYCSDKCGSNVRVRKIRKNQKARQMQ